MRLHEHKQVAGVFALLLVVVAQGTSWLYGQRLPDLAKQLIRTLIKAVPEPFGVFRFGGRPLGPSMPWVWKRRLYS
jgi:hypothetical protein